VAADAETHLQKAFELEPETIVVLRSLFDFYIQQRQAQKAVLAIDAGIPDAERGAVHYELLAQAYSSLQKFQDAEAALRKAIQREPNRSSSYSALGQLYLKMGNLDKIPQEMDDLLKVNPRSAFAYVMKGYALQLLGQPRDVTQEYSRALEIEPNNVFAANNLAYHLAERNEDLTTALKWAQAARRLQPESGEIADTLGWVFYKQGSYLLAREQLRFAASKLPESEVVWFHLGATYLKANQPQEAEVALRRALGTKRDFKERSQAQSALADLRTNSR
jgi:tetratricopeptide (TPR) repeat protein